MVHGERSVILLFKMVAKKLYVSLISSWQTVLYWIVALAVLGGLLFFKLGTLVGPAPAEMQAYNSAQTTKQIIDNPLNAPYKLARTATVKLVKQPSVLALRVSSAVFGLVFAVLLYYVLKHWLTWRMAALGTLLFASSSWFLHVARLGTDLVSQWVLIAIAAYGVWVLRTRRFEIALLSGVFLLSFALYTPGMAWFVIPAAIWQRNRLKQMLIKTKLLWQVVTVLLALGLLTPLFISLLREPKLLTAWLGLPEQVPSVVSVAKNFLQIPLNLLARGPDNPTLWLGTVPILDAFASVMALLGAYSYYFKYRLDRVRLLAIILVIGTFLISLDGALNITLLIPFIFILVANGFTLMTQQWFTVFPRNPLARVLGLTLITVTVFLSVYYQLNHYFVAWPNAPATLEAFNAPPAN